MSQLVRDAGPTKGKLTTQKEGDYYMQGEIYVSRP